MGALQSFSDDAAVEARPHFHLKGDELYFLNSQRPAAKLSNEQREFWNSLQDSPTLHALNANFPDNTNELLTFFVEQAFCDVFEPVKGDRKKVLVLEPHCDDAALSAGATMWAQRQEKEFTIVTLASRSNYTSNFQTHKEFFKRDVVSHLRDDEGRIFAKHLGGHYKTAALNEATLRYHDSDWTLDYYLAHRASVSASNNHQAREHVLSEWRKVISRILTETEARELWLPLGAGYHADHELTRNAALLELIENDTLKNKFEIILYQDVPYDFEFETHKDAIIETLRKDGAALTYLPEDAGENFAKKLSLLTIFASQFKVKNVQGGVEGSATAQGERAEHFWRLESLPHSLNPADYYIDKEQVDATAEKLAAEVLTTFARGELDLELLLVPWSDRSARFEGPAGERRVQGLSQRHRGRSRAVGIAQPDHQALRTQRVAGSVTLDDDLRPLVFGLERQRPRPSPVDRDRQDDQHVERKTQRRERRQEHAGGQHEGGDPESDEGAAGGYHTPGPASAGERGTGTLAIACSMTRAGVTPSSSASAVSRRRCDQQGAASR